MSVNLFFHIIKYTSALSVLLPLSCCCLKIKTLNRELRVLFLYILVSAAAEASGFFLTINYVQTYIVQNLFTVLECTLIAGIYYLKFESRVTKKMILAFYLFFIALSFYLLLFKGAYNQQDNVLNTIESSFFIVLAYFYFYSLLKDLNIARLTEYYFTWINVAFLLYFSASFVMFLFNDYIEKFSIQLFYIIYCFYLVASIAYNIILSIGIWKTRRS